MCKYVLIDIVLGFVWCCVRVKFFCILVWGNSMGCWKMILIFWEVYGVCIFVFFFMLVRVWNKLFFFVFDGLVILMNWFCGCNEICVLMWLESCVDICMLMCFIILCDIVKMIECCEYYEWKN